jgi:hypothetical protein
MGPALRVDASRRRLLDAVVADRLGRRERFLEVALAQLALGQRRVTPHAGQAIGL